MLVWCLNLLSVVISYNSISGKNDLYAMTYSDAMPINVMFDFRNCNSWISQVDTPIVLHNFDSIHSQFSFYKDTSYNDINHFQGILNFTTILILKTTFTVSPSITTDRIKLFANEAFSGSMFIYDVLGRIIFQRKLDAALGEIKEFSLSSLSPGMYILVFSTGSNSSSNRLIKL